MRNVAPNREFTVNSIEHAAADNRDHFRYLCSPNIQPERCLYVHWKEKRREIEGIKRIWSQTKVVGNMRRDRTMKRMAATHSSTITSDMLNLMSNAANVHYALWDADGTDQRICSCTVAQASLSLSLSESIKSNGVILNCSHTFWHIRISCVYRTIQKYEPTLPKWTIFIEVYMVFDHM